MKLDLIRYRFIKCVIVFLYLLFCTPHILSAQYTIQNIKIYKTWVTFNSEPFKIIGVLYQLKDSSIVLSNSISKNDYPDNIKTSEFNINTIEEIRIRRKNGIGKGALIGAISGLAIGVLVGYLSYEESSGGIDFGRGFSATGSGFFGAFLGAGVGVIFGTIKLRIPIQGKIENYNRNISSLRKRSIKKN